MRYLSLVAVLLLGIGAACGGDEREPVGAANQPSEETSTPTTASPPIRAVFVDPADPARLLVSVNCVRVATPDGPSTVVASEEPGRVVIEVAAPVLDPPCNPAQFNLQLKAPLGDRTVMDAAGSELPVATYVPPDPGRLVPAECNEQAARAVVAADVDGNLRSEILGCAEGWMAVRTSTDACPATGEAPAEGCIGNVHTVFWWDTDGHWTITGFDDCDQIRRQYPGPPPALCEPSD